MSLNNLRIILKKQLTLLTTVVFLVLSCEDKSGDSAPVPDVIDISSGSAQLVLKPGQTIQLKARVIDKKNQEIVEAKVVWSSENDGVATVDEKGVVTAIDVGVTTIFATYETVQGMREVTVSIIKKRVLSEMFTSST